ncbi:uncharacterized protein PHACADRAFT_212742 [Phanerochaete carnosa HHB-10118-sp]|uniref:LCCL domain-containing protein n=1 Tax=Phanerochaete carnosa (strain HHB-10118-sp) TaxID=650164 RepID=K5WPA5_PHACS|nr:uncharacterized protein PHACADRAFT_212742 [Phanerochaete carnosa HHB-10118-sp]EKM52172.1 hypothetical protein PHACADRAFT_212742 [Phanerochaete carnosa HHB-10118-sp]
MAVPANMTTLDLSGKYNQNKTLSNNTDIILSKQGVSYFVRMGINMGTLAVIVKHEHSSDGAETLAVDQSLSGGLGRTSQARTLDWEPRDTDSKFFGKTTIRTKRATIDDLENAWLREGWVEEACANGLILDSVQSEPKDGKTWCTDIVWGIEEIDGERRYTRHIAFTGPDGKETNARIVYDYLGPLN